jgi:hypothetical protein
MPSNVISRLPVGTDQTPTDGRVESVVRIPWAASRLAHPLTLAAVGVTLALAPPLLSTAFQRSRWGVPWYLTLTDYRLIALSGVVVLIGIILGAAGRRGLDPVFFYVDVRRLRRATDILLALFALGYVVWTWSAHRHGFSVGLALSTLKGTSGANYAARADLATVPGISTLTEVGPVLVAALVLLWRCGVRRRAALTAVIALSAVRAILNSERLSMIEIALPILLMVLMTRDRRETDTTRRRPLLVVGFLAAPAAILALFVVTERSRTWNSHYSRLYPGSLLQFSLDRIWGYYATAANNGAIYRDFRAPTLHFPELTLQGLTHAPGSSEIITMAGFQIAGTHSWLDTLGYYSNPEFNSPSTFLPVIGEIGLPLALCLFAAWGLAMGKLYRHARQGSVGCLVAVAGLSLGLLELARYPYYSSGRFVAGTLGAVIVWSATRSRPVDGPNRPMGKRRM